MKLNNVLGCALLEEKCKNALMPTEKNVSNASKVQQNKIQVLHKGWNSPYRNIVRGLIA